MIDHIKAATSKSKSKCSVVALRFLHFIRYLLIASSLALAFEEEPYIIFIGLDSRSPTLFPILYQKKQPKSVSSLANSCWIQRRRKKYIYLGIMRSFKLILPLLIINEPLFELLLRHSFKTTTDCYAKKEWQWAPIDSIEFLPCWLTMITDMVVSYRSVCFRVFRVWLALTSWMNEWIQIDQNRQRARYYLIAGRHVLGN